MKKILTNHLFLYLFIIVLASSISSCKKEKGDSTPTTPTTTALSDADSLKYLMYNIMQVCIGDGRDTVDYFPSYYWYNQVPKLNPLSSDYDSADVLLAKIKTYPINPATGKLFDKYSFLDHGQVAGEIQQGVGGDMGMEIAPAKNPAGKYFWYVLFSDPNSPAGLAGVTRGWQITAINGNTNIAYDASNGPHTQTVVNAVYNAPSANFTFLSPSGTSVTKTLTQAVYNINPVLFDTVYSVGSKKVGYFVFNSFAAVDNGSGPTLTKQQLNRVFAKFQSAGISSLIVDLRYNGGGAVQTTQYLDSLIAPASVAGKEMYHYLYNDKLTALNSQQPFLQQKVLFTAGGSLNLQNVFFIGTGNTASASELTINNLKPYMTVKLVGDTTYGKPVGFFTFHITDFPNGGPEKALADLYAINFETRNANNEGGYFDGMIPDAVATDFVNYAWGDPSDDNLQKIFSFISTGAFSRKSASERMAENSSLRMSVPATIRPLRFNGMVDYRISNQLKERINKSLRRG